MVTYVHETPGSWLAKAATDITNRLEEAARCGRPYVYSRGSSTVDLPGMKLQSDMCLLLHTDFGKERKHPKYPRLVLETAYSQSLDDVKEKAWKWLHRSDRGIHAVLICNMKPRISLVRDFKADISVWVREPTEDGSKCFGSHLFALLTFSRR